MSGSPPSTASGSSQPTTNGPADDPLAADKRTLIMALIAMIVLVSIGIVSAAVFTGSACQDVSPSPVTVGAASAEVDEVLSTAFPDAGREVITAIGAQLDGVAESFGPISGVASVDGADALSPTSDGVAATGPVTSLLPASGSAVTASVDVGRGVVVGSGDALVSLARVNDLTGQVDAFATIDATATGGLTEIGCIDTATVGTPLAFELDAADGQLLLFRADEDGDDAELELRDPRDGRLWFTRVDVGMAPPGVTGERIDGRLGDDVAVLVRSTAPDEDTPLATAVDRVDGAVRWQLGREELQQLTPGMGTPEVSGNPDTGTGSSILRGDAAQRLEVLALDSEQVVVAVTGARDEDAAAAGGTDALGPSIGPGHLVALDVRDGTPRWRRALPAGASVTAARTGDAAVWLVIDDGEQPRLVGIDAAGEAVEGSRTGVLAVLGERLMGVGSDGQSVVGDGAGPLRPRDVLAIEDRVHVLFGGPGSGAGPGSEDRALLVTFARGG